jgi:glycosyltransferase involved in cell wall biosynthesis
VQFAGRLPYRDYLRLLQVGSAHIYLTVPFVLSWSCLEAMPSGAVIIGSRTPPVEEVIEDGRNGLLVDFFDPAGIAACIAEALDAGGALDALRERARETVVARYDLRRCLTEQMRLIQSLG